MDNDNLDKFVNFEEYCKKCKFKDVDDTKGEEPCNECLSTPVNENSEKPICFKEKEEK